MMMIQSSCPPCKFSSFLWSRWTFLYNELFSIWPSLFLNLSYPPWNLGHMYISMCLVTCWSFWIMFWCTKWHNKVYREFLFNGFNQYCHFPPFFSLILVRPCSSLVTQFLHSVFLIPPSYFLSFYVRGGLLTLPTALFHQGICSSFQMTLSSGNAL